MSGRAGEAARGGGAGRGGQDGGRSGRGGGRGGRSGNKAKVKKAPKHISKTDDIKHDVFECGTAASAAQFEKSNRAIIEHIRRDGAKELILIAKALETGVVPAIPVPPRPPQLPDPNQ